MFGLAVRERTFYRYTRPSEHGQIRAPRLYGVLKDIANAPQTALDSLRDVAGTIISARTVSRKMRENKKQGLQPSALAYPAASIKHAPKQSVKQIADTATAPEPTPATGPKGKGGALARAASVLTKAKRRWIPARPDQDYSVGYSSIPHNWEREYAFD